MPDRIMRRLNGPRGSGLLAGAVLAGAHAVAYVDVSPSVPLPAGLDLLDQAVSLPVYAGAWAATALVAAWGSWRSRTGAQRDHADAWGHGLVAAMLYLWGAAYVLGWAIAAATTGGADRQWVVGVLYLAVGLLIAAASRMTNPQPRPPTGGCA